MRLATPYPRLTGRWRCTGCERPIDGERHVMAVDLEGTPYASYYCPACTKEILTLQGERDGSA